MIRACCLRNMSYVDVPKIVELLKTPLLDSLNDNNPLVAKTAALAVLKLAMLDPGMLRTSPQYVESLYKLVESDDPMVKHLYIEFGINLR